MLFTLARRGRLGLIEAEELAHLFGRQVLGTTEDVRFGYALPTQLMDLQST